MKKFNNLQKFNKKKLLQEEDYITRLPPLEGGFENRKTNPNRKVRGRIEDLSPQRGSKTCMNPPKSFDYPYPSYGKKRKWLL